MFDLTREMRIDWSGWFAHIVDVPDVVR
jgi:hypothetical protein